MLNVFEKAGTLMCKTFVFQWCFQFDQSDVELWEVEWCLWHCLFQCGPCRAGTMINKTPEGTFGFPLPAQIARCKGCQFCIQIQSFRKQVDTMMYKTPGRTITLSRIQAACVCTNKIVENTKHLHFHYLHRLHIHAIAWMGYVVRTQCTAEHNEEKAHMEGNVCSAHTYIGISRKEHLQSNQWVLLLETSPSSRGVSSR